MTDLVSVSAGTACTRSVVGSSVATVAGSSVSTGAVRPVAVIEAWLLMVVPLVTVTAMRAVKPTVKLAPSATAPTFQVMVRVAAL